MITNYDNNGNNNIDKKFTKNNVKQDLSKYKSSNTTLKKLLSNMKINTVINNENIITKDLLKKSNKKYGISKKILTSKNNYLLSLINKNNLEYKKLTDNIKKNKSSNNLNINNIDINNINKKNKIILQKSQENKLKDTDNCNKQVIEKITHENINSNCNITSKNIHKEGIDIISTLKNVNKLISEANISSGNTINMNNNINISINISNSNKNDDKSLDNQDNLFSINKNKYIQKNSKEGKNNLIFI